MAVSHVLRSRIASVIWLVAVVCALFLAIGALLVALKLDQDDDVVGFILGGARGLDLLGPFTSFTGKDAATRSALVDWGLHAIIYLVLGKVLDRIIRPGRAV